MNELKYHDILRINEMRRVTIIPIGWMDDATISTIKNFLSVITDMDVRLGEKIEVPRYAYDHRRDQYRVQNILDILSYKHSGGDFIIGVTDVDLYKDRRDFVFGSSNLINGVCAISILRLKVNSPSEKDNIQLFRKRVLTEAVHEIGHLLGLLNCRNETCVMHEPATLEDIDRKGYEFCSSCSRSLDRSSFRDL